jgi:hypothetical protein
MTWEQRVNSVSRHGFTKRQAAFLVHVMLHAGVCVGRQYCAFAGITYGQVVSDFFRSLVERGYASPHRCGNSRWRVFHVHHKGLYRAIGETDNRHRKPTAVARAVERLMILDAVLAERQLAWLATERDKFSYFTLAHRIPNQDLPSLIFRTEDSETVRYFPEKLPIGLDADGRTHVFLFLLAHDVPMDFRNFLERHAELLRALPAWTVRLVVPAHKSSAVPLYKTAFHEHVASPLRPAIAAELRWYFTARKRRPADGEERFDQSVRAFAAARFQALYRVWLERGDVVLEATQSATLAEAVARGAGRLESHVLPYQYTHLFPLVGTA